MKDSEHVQRSGKIMRPAISCIDCPVAAASASMNLKLRKFNMAEIADDKVVELVGKRDTGNYYSHSLLTHAKPPPCM